MNRAFVFDTHIIFRVILLVLFAVIPLTTFAQEEDALRAAIRADITSDPRSAEMSPTEIDAMVNALAARAEEQGVADQYLETRQNTFDDPAPAPVFEEVVTLDTLAISIAALVAVLLGVGGFLFWQRKHKRKGLAAEINS